MKKLLTLAVALCTTAAFAGAPSTTGLSTAEPKKPAAKISTTHGTGTSTRVVKEKAATESPSK